MAPVDVERVYAVFQRFAVSPVSSPAAGSSRSPAADALREAYIPTCFLTAAAREAGFYPAVSTIQRFVKTAPSAAAGAVTFAAFLQLCEDVAHTNRPGRSAVYELVDDIDTRGSGIISRRELVHILTSGAPTITEGEVSAILQLLDPSNSGYVCLNDLATALIESCERQRSPRSRSRSAREHQAQQQALAARAQAEFERRQAAPSPSASGNGAAARRPHSRQSSAERVDPQLYTAPPQQQQPRRVLRPRGFNAPRSPSSPAAHDPQTPEKQRHRHHHHHHQPPHASGEGERDRSFKRTDIGSHGEVVVRPYSSTVSRADAFERTQTAMTVDVDVQPSTWQPTAMAAGRSRSRGFSKPSPSPGAASAGAAVGSTPPRQANPAPGSAGSSPAAASLMRPPLPTVPPPPGTAAASESTTDEPRLRPGAAVSAEGNDAARRASEQLDFSKAEPERRKSGVGGGGCGEAAAADGEEGDAARGAAAIPPPRPPAQKESGGKCCIVM